MGLPLSGISLASDPNGADISQWSMYSRKGQFTYKLIVFVTTSEDQCVEIENAGEKKVLNECCNSFLSSSLVIVENSVTLIWMHPKFFYNYFFIISNKFLQTPIFFLQTLTDFFTNSNTFYKYHTFSQIQ